MTPEQIDAVQRSFAALGDGGADLAVRFYDRLFALDPSTRGLFTSDPVEQRRKFVDELEAIVWSISNLDAFLERTMALGARHAGYGTTAGHYHVVRDALLGALADELGEAFTPELEAAWRVSYNLVAETMMMGAASGAPAPPA